MNWLVSILIAVLGSQPIFAVHFDNEIMPLLTKFGCNSGACHGAAAGRGNFHLSLLGANPDADYEAIVQEFEGRRINLARPELSLILAKPTGKLDHGGDVVLDDEGMGTRRLLDWIQAGAPRGRPRRLKSLEVTPHRHVSSQVPDAVPLRVIAQFDDQAHEDVTEWTVFTSADPEAVRIGVDSVATIQTRGQHTVIARFLDRVIPMQFNVPWPQADVDLSGELRMNFIDHEIFRVLSEMQIPVSPSASDATWLRRVSLDLTGRLPEPAIVDEFVADASFDKWNRTVTRLLSSDAYAEYWTLRFAKLLRLHSLPNDKKGIQVYADWLQSEIKNGTGLDKIAHQMLTATGDTHEVGPANFASMVADPRDHAELVGQFFLGIRIGCANCHNHPFDKWTQDDYHGLAAIFASLERGRHVRFTPRGVVTNLRTHESAIPRIPGERYLSVVGDHREELAVWLTNGTQPYFARAMVNRLWHAMFGRGLVEPTDDLRETNPPTHPELLKRLADHFIENGFNIRHTLELISLSSTYRRSGVSVPGNVLDDRFYSHAYHRPLLAEVLVDAISDVTGVANEYEGKPSGTRAVSLVDPLAPAPSLDIFGRCTSVKGCDEMGASGGGLPAQLHLLNGELVNQKITDPRGRLQTLWKAGRTEEQIINEFFQRALCRKLSVDELQAWQNRVADGSADERQKQLEDFVWSLLNSRRFMSNH
jgi:Protein of unknown function (DUF1549)/Protein of unknown function (DUF1553)